MWRWARAYGIGGSSIYLAIVGAVLLLVASESDANVAWLLLILGPPTVGAALYLRGCLNAFGRTAQARRVGVDAHGPLRADQLQHVRWAAAAVFPPGGDSAGKWGEGGHRNGVVAELRLRWARERRGTEAESPVPAPHWGRWARERLGADAESPRMPGQPPFGGKPRRRDIRGVLATQHRRFRAQRPRRAATTAKCEGPAC